MYLNQTKLTFGETNETLFNRNGLSADFRIECASDFVKGPKALPFGVIPHTVTRLTLPISRTNNPFNVQEVYLFHGKIQAYKPLKEANNLFEAVAKGFNELLDKELVSYDEVTEFIKVIDKNIKSHTNFLYIWTAMVDKCILEGETIKTALNDIAPMIVMLLGKIIAPGNLCESLPEFVTHFGWMIVYEKDGRVHHLFSQEVETDAVERPEATRLGRRSLVEDARVAEKVNWTLNLIGGLSYAWEHAFQKEYQTKVKVRKSFRPKSGFVKKRVNILSLDKKKMAFFTMKKIQKEQKLSEPTGRDVTPHDRKGGDFTRWVLEASLYPDEDYSDIQLDQKGRLWMLVTRQRKGAKVLGGAKEPIKGVIR